MWRSTRSWREGERQSVWFDFITHFIYFYGRSSSFHSTFSKRLWAPFKITISVSLLFSSFSLVLSQCRRRLPRKTSVHCYIMLLVSIQMAALDGGWGVLPGCVYARVWVGGHDIIQPCYHFLEINSQAHTRWKCLCTFLFRIYFVSQHSRTETEIPITAKIYILFPLGSCFSGKCQGSINRGIHLHSPPPPPLPQVQSPSVGWPTVQIW